MSQDREQAEGLRSRWSISTIDQDFSERSTVRWPSGAASSGPPPIAGSTAAGVVLAGKYRLSEEVGRGSVGTVYRAVDESLDRVVAVKFLRPELRADPKLNERFHHEAKAMASVRHENVVRVFDLGAFGATLYIVMEHIEGEPLDERIERAAARHVMLPIESVVWILMQTALGLGAVHAAGVVHRDVKPANIMVEHATGRAVIMDFGIGKRYGPDDERRSQADIGSPAYMAPELVRGDQVSSREDVLTDIYALGVTAYELLTNALPFEGADWVDALLDRVTSPAPRPSSRRPDLPAGLDEVVFRCLATSPRHRFQSCDELALALEPFAPAGAVRRSRSPAAGRRRPSRTSSSAPTPVSRPVLALAPARTPRRVARRLEGLLVADTDLDLVRTTHARAIAASPGLRFRAVRTNTKALELALHAPPRLMVARLDDAELNGLELAACVRGDPGLDGMRLVLTCDRISAVERRTLHQLGVFKILLRPVDPAELETLLGPAA